MKDSQTKGMKLYDKMKISENMYEKEQMEQLKVQNQKLKKQLKQTKAKRVQITKQCSQMARQLEQIKNKNYQLEQKLQNSIQNTQSQKYPLQQLKFLNRELNTQIQQLRIQNNDLNQKIKYSKEVIQRKYDQLQNKTFKRIQQSIKRLKKSIHYLQSLSAKQIQKTKEVLVENLGKAVQLLRGKYTEQDPNMELQQLMNPLKVLQQQIHDTKKQLNRLKDENLKLQQQLNRHRKIEKELLPQYKQALQKLKRNLGDVRCQLAQNQYDKDKVKRHYQQEIKNYEIKYNDLFTQFRKIQLQNKIYKTKLEDLQQDVEEEKQRLMEQNNILKKLYQNQQDYQYIQKRQDPNLSQFSERQVIRKNHSSKQIKKPLKRNQSFRSRSRKQSTYGLNDESSVQSQESLKNEILKIDQQIVQIQQTLAKQLDMYR